MGNEEAARRGAGHGQRDALKLAVLQREVQRAVVAGAAGRREAGTRQSARLAGPGGGPHPSSKTHRIAVGGLRGHHVAPLLYVMKVTMFSVVGSWALAR